jgi:regulatory protein
MLTSSVMGTVADCEARMGSDMDGDEITPELLEQWALGYLGRYASSSENLRRVLMRRVRRRVPQAAQNSAASIDALIIRYREGGLLDDATYAAGKVQSLSRRGGSLRSIRARLAGKGVARSDVDDALSGLRGASADPDLSAACAFARRRRLGPFRRLPPDHARELAAFARAGFSRRMAEAVLACTDAEMVERLAQDGMR